MIAHSECQPHQLQYRFQQALCLFVPLNFHLLDTMTADAIVFERHGLNDKGCCGSVLPNSDR